MDKVITIITHLKTSINLQEGYKLQEYPKVNQKLKQGYKIFSVAPYNDEHQGTLLIFTLVLDLSE
jgi:hypothetical protein